MLQRCGSTTAVFLLLTTVFTPVSAQDGAVHGPPYRGVNVQMAGVFVTPVAGAPFSAVVQLESTQVLPDGTSTTKKSINNIARDSRGRIYNERRPLLPSSFTGTPPVLSSLIFDPETRLSTSLDSYTHLARQRTVPAPQTAAGAPGAASPAPSASTDNPLFRQEDLGSNTMEYVAVHGARQTRTIPAAATGASKDIIVVDEYWYSEELHMNMLTKHDDPRTGMQIVTLTQVDRNEPDPAMFQIPSGYKVIDENPPK